jgi:hypothetical protein
MTKSIASTLVLDDAGSAQFDEVNFSGVAVVERREGRRVLVIYSSREDALRAGLSPQRAEQLFPNTITLGGPSRVTRPVFDVF